MTEHLETKSSLLPKENFISNYDLNSDYLYKTFWQGREYEHRAEFMLLKRLFRKFVYSEQNREQVLLDLGGSFGRLSDLYLGRFKYSVIGDYSLQELNEARQRLFNRDPRLYLVGLNAYKMPFKDNSIDFVLSVRLTHHIRYLDIFAKEIFRVLKPGGLLILEAAHKNHIKAILRTLINRDFAFFKKEQIQVKHDPRQAQGIKETSKQIPIMYNFSAKFVVDTFANSVGFRLQGIFPCSFFRLQLLKDKVPLPVLVTLERFLQKFPFLKVTPSLFYVFSKPTKEVGLGESGAEKFVDILQCPGGAELAFEGRRILCDNKVTQMVKVGARFFDLRDPRPDKIKF